MGTTLGRTGWRRQMAALPKLGIAVDGGPNAKGHGLWGAFTGATEKQGPHSEK